LNANLPEDIVVLQLAAAPEGFHPRFDARRRTYHYLICNSMVRRPLCRKRCWHISLPLDVDLMNQATALLVGTHDFATFGRPPKGENSVREVYQAIWQRKEARLRFEITANAFLYRMVRSLVGSLKAVGTGEWTIAQFEDCFRARQRFRSAPAAPAHGLYLVSVDYE
jgi:tRNA pseudouridine38-40 synthase